MPPRAQLDPGKISYPCIFESVPEDAAQNLCRLITDQDCGYDEGVDFWLEITSDLLRGGSNFQHLNCHGTTFSDAWWRDALIRLDSQLRAYKGRVS